MIVLSWILGAATLLGGLLLIFEFARRIVRLTRGPHPLRIYIAGPLTKGILTDNIHNALAAADQLLKAGYAPYVPHLTVYWNNEFEHHYETWMQLDFAFLAACDAVVRIPGESPGADRETDLARQRGIPVFYGVEEFLQAHGSRHD